MKYLKIPWYFFKGTVKLIIFWVTVMVFPLFILPAMILDVGGLKNSTHKTFEKFEWILNKVSEM